MFCALPNIKKNESEGHEANHIGLGSLGLPEELGKRSRQGTAQLCLLWRPRPCAMLVPGVMAGSGVRVREMICQQFWTRPQPKLSSSAGSAVHGWRGSGSLRFPMQRPGKEGELWATGAKCGGDWDVTSDSRVGLPRLTVGGPCP